MKYDDAKDLEKLVPGSKAYESDGRLVWEAPKRGHRLSGKKQKGDGGQDENQEPLFRIKRPFWFRGTPARPWYFEDNKDGVQFKADRWKLTHCHFRRPGEECITSFGEFGELSDCTFEADGDSDKCLQLNVTNRVTVTRCSFFGFITAIQCGLTKYAKKEDMSTVTYCHFDDCEASIKSIRGVVYENNNRFYDGKNELITDNGGRFIHG